VTRALGGDGEAVELARQADREIADVDHFLHLAEAFRDDLSGFEGDDGAERLLRHAQLLAEEPHELSPARGRDVAPGGEGGLRAGDHRRHVGKRRLPNPRDLGAVDRRAHDERAAAHVRRRQLRPPQNVLAGHESRPSSCERSVRPQIARAGKPSGGSPKSFRRRSPV